MTLVPWERILAGHLGLEPGERVLVLVDDGDAGVPGAEIVAVPSSGGHGREPAREAWEAAFGCAAIAGLDMSGLLDPLLEKKVTPQDEAALADWAANCRGLVPAAIVCLTRFSSSHTAFRRLLNAAGVRYASLPGYGDELRRAGGPLDVDPSRLRDRTHAVASRLDGAGRALITTPRGTNLELDLTGRSFRPDDGDLTRPGSFGNLPAGEVYAAPVEGSAKGRLALESGGVVEIRGGRAIAVEGDATLERIFAGHPEFLQVAELGIGTNEGADPGAGVLEAEKALGTVHVAFGDNSSFGGTLRLPYHVDHVLARPTLVIDGAPFELPRP